ncbi:unnamed protein product, partial [Staurois parvus]
MCRRFWPLYVLMSQGPEAGEDGRGCCRRDIAGEKGKVSAAGNPRTTLHGKPECSSGLPLLLHSGIPPGRL